MSIPKLSPAGKVYLFLLIPAVILSLTFGLPLVFDLLKPLIIPILIFEVYQRSKSWGGDQPLFRWLYAALVLSWLGDVFLMFESENGLFFILGLASFLLAHIGYIVSMTLTSDVPFSSSIKSPRALYIILIAGYAVVFLKTLYPGLGEMQVPVFLYAFVIMSMIAVAVMRSAPGSRVVLAGAMLFVVSDSVLAYAKFMDAFTGSREFTMFTYMLAQLLLVQGFLWAVKERTLSPRH